MALTKVTYSMIEGAPVNVLDFGADPTGLTDSTAALQSALNAAAANNASIISQSDATYLLTSALVIPDNSYIDFYNSKLLGFGITVTNATNVQINGVQFEDTVASATWCIKIDASTNVRLSNIRCENVYSGILFQNSNNSTCEFTEVYNCANSAYNNIGCSDIHYTNIRTYNAVWGFNCPSTNYRISVQTGYFELGAASTTPTGNISFYTDPPEHGMYIHNSFDCEFRDITCKGWKDHSGVNGVKLRELDGILLDNITIDDCERAFGITIQVNTVGNNFVRNCKISNCVAKNIVTSNLFVEDYVGAPSSQEMQIDFYQCTFEDNKDININGANTTSYVIFTNCIFNYGFVSGGGFAGLIEFDSCTFIDAAGPALDIIKDGTSKLVVKGCTFYNWNKDNNPTGGGGNSETLPAAIRIANLAKNVTIIGCSFLQNAKRRIGARGTVAGAIDNIVISKCVGGNDIYGFQSGGSATSYVEGCTSYAGITGTFFNSASNNIQLNNNGTVTVY